MVIKNAKYDKLAKEKKYSKRDTSYSSFWLYNREADMNSEAFKDKFVNFYDDKNTLSEFNPAVAKNIISFWSNDGDIVLDPFSGRTRAIVSYAMNRSYVGFEVSKDVVNYMYNRFEDIGILNNQNFNIDIINDDCVNVKNYLDGKVDLVFSCPPYWNLEKYESCPGQLSDTSEYSVFLKRLKQRSRESADLLKVGGFMCMVVGDFRRRGAYIKFHSDLLSEMEDFKDMELHDVICIQNIPFHTAAFYFGSSKRTKRTAKAHEYLLVWRKIK
jgi:DNA modification methylase